jgi:hypothetical protein
MKTINDASLEYLEGKTLPGLAALTGDDGAVAADEHLGARATVRVSR